MTPELAGTFALLSESTLRSAGDGVQLRLAAGVTVDGDGSASKQFFRYNYRRTLDADKAARLSVEIDTF